jgi:hypothetical protein
MAVKEGWERDNISSVTTNVVLHNEIKELRSEISELKKEAIKSNALQSDILTLLRSMNLGTGASSNDVIVQVSNGADLSIIVNTANSDDIVEDAVIEPDRGGGGDLNNGAGVEFCFDCADINDKSLDGVEINDDSGAEGGSNAGVNGGIDGVEINDESLDGVEINDYSSAESGSGAGAGNSLSLSVSTDHASGAKNSTVPYIKKGRGKGKNNKPKAQMTQKNNASTGKPPCL